MSYALGVDLGTTFTRAAVCRPGERPSMVTISEHQVLMPSVVRVREDGTLTVGDLLRQSDEDAPDRISRDFKRRMGDPTPLILGGQPHSAVALMASTLSNVVQQVTLLEGEPPGRIVLTCPAVWGAYRREQFDDVPQQAGLSPELVSIFTEPVAAARHYALVRPMTHETLLAVYDLGGGTFDTAVIRADEHRMELVGVPEGVEWVGGIDFDKALLEHVDRATDGAVSALSPEDALQGRALRQLRDECIWAKEAVSRTDKVTIPVIVPGRHQEVSLSREEFESMIRPAIESTIAAVHRALASAGHTAADLSGILLVGGSSRIPLVRELLERELGCPVLTGSHPQHSVALGAAVIAAERLGEIATTSPAVPGPRTRALTTGAALGLFAAVVSVTVLVGLLVSWLIAQL
ncbi:Hsp70 family protein [Kineosporia sp. J2-2]|uniref:Hsp70 family protein n=1 Tax=Kineosporia corallincola TaxID=2835133 RepID=A0ABS5TAR6_9ACTN|nr:Hsp70 family protein [Kineosporia corallincola]MBT0768152.1 Hsp70 family protein [Kineosporia corallincola]